jgi:hypothetical protein
MFTTVRRMSLVASLALALLPVTRATTIPRLTFEQLTDGSEIVAAGRITGSWAAWDSDRRYIWTHYSLSVTDLAKGIRASSVEFAEPGGAVGDRVMSIAGTVTYGVGDRVVVFLSRMPNGYLRTTGWAQGKYMLDVNGILHGSAIIGAEAMDARQPAAGASLRTLEGIEFADLKQRVAARVRATAGRVQ